MNDSSAVGILPLYAIEEDFRTGRVVRLEVTPKPPAMRLVALHCEIEKHHPVLNELVLELENLVGFRRQRASA